MLFAPQPAPRAGLHYRLSGTYGAPWLVFVHALATDMRLWDPVIERIGGRFRVLTWDLRGHGLSDTPAGPWSITDLADDLLALTDYLRIERFALCGISVGGQVALDVALQAPERLDAVVFSNTGLKIGNAEGWAERIATATTHGMTAVADGNIERWFTDSFRADPARLTPWRTMVTRSPVEGFTNTAAALRDADYTGRAASIRVPSLVIGAEHDTSTPPDLARTVAATVPDARLEIMDGVAHLPNVQDPDAYAVLLNTFIPEVARRTRPA
ncbi:3-oxoadipate enol-lactonase [Roseospira marina]|uniref:3-oxoadipate enol-lactonase n=1 Tax=Roseospira marina TaxID=140057 RepID=A0A5M6IH00_9PROT|nr:3-oxoadipate enol-lactonase [Roseospira marina]KAA5607029.1 3-oxoadipate enol-lactonase [Roseospira marina]MBB4312785.1 3-oxoadipate enol-lactonase [Roseospira marina]MBB5086442.1 3-oxoadipate enol-lactonase [Roseospira marina]